MAPERIIHAVQSPPCPSPPSSKPRLVWAPPSEGTVICWDSNYCGTTSCRGEFVWSVRKW